MQIRNHIILLTVLMFSISTVVARDKETKVLSDRYQIATFAGGCFWCMQSPFDNTEGVVRTVVGYAGGTEENPTYEQVSQYRTSHVEAIQVTFDPKRVNYNQLLEIFWHNIDPLDAKGQFCDKGPQYLAKIFTHNVDQNTAALKSKETVQQRFTPNAVVTEILPFTTFYDAEAYHQNYYKRNVIRYNFYRYSCGRDKRLEALWEKE